MIMYKKLYRVLLLFFCMFATIQPQKWDSFFSNEELHLIASYPRNYVYIPHNVRELLQVLDSTFDNDMHIASYDQILAALPRAMSVLETNKERFEHADVQEVQELLDIYYRAVCSGDACLECSEDIERKHGCKVFCSLLVQCSLTTGNLVATGNATIGGSLNIAGDTRVGGNLSVARDVSIFGDETVNNLGVGCSIFLFVDPSTETCGNIFKGTPGIRFITNMALTGSGDKTNFYAGEGAGPGTGAGLSAPGVNTGIGAGALTSLSTGIANTAVGAFALVENTSGNSNTAVGQFVLGSNSSGFDNTAVGMNALQNNTIGIGNTAMGLGALSRNTTGVSNIAIGNAPMSAPGANTGSHNIAIGNRALEINTTGSENVAIGDQALASNTIGFNNVVVGRETIIANQGGFNNTAVGSFSLNGSVGDGSQNTAVGALSGLTNNTGSDNILIGYQANVDQDPRNNSIIIGSGTVALTAAGDNQIRIGFGTNGMDSCYIDGIFGQTVDAGTDVPVLIDATGKLGTVASSKRYKENIQKLPSVADLFMKLSPVCFHYKNDPTKRDVYGLIAEEVADVLPNLVVYKDGQVETVRYHLLDALYIKMIQEQQLQIQEQQRQIEQLQQRIEKLES